MGSARPGTNTVSNMDPYKVPWFADCAPSLLTNKTIRRYLDAYSQHTWPEVIKLTLIYGVLGLEQQFPGSALSIPQLRKLVEKGAAQLVVERNLPGLQRQILNLQTGLDAVFDRLVVEAPPPTPGAADRQGANAAAAAATKGHKQVRLSPPQPQQQQRQSSMQLAASQQHQQQMWPEQQQPVQLEAAGRNRTADASRPARALNPSHVASKPSDTWRRGEATGFPSPTRNTQNPLRRSLDNQGATNPIYPDWWLAAGPYEPPSPKQQPRKQPRKQPRLAYSVQQQQTEASPAADDLVTAEYLMLPGSGYGQQQPQPVVAGDGPPVMLTTCTAEGSTTRPLGPPDTRQPQTAAAAAAGRARAAGSIKPAAARRPQAAQSKIREAVVASRRKAASQQQHRQRLLASAVAAGSSLFGPSPAQQQQQPRRSSSAAAEAVAVCAPAAAADQFLSNPWTSCFLAPSAVKADVSGVTQLPLAAADITPDDEARLAALQEQGGFEGQDEGGLMMTQPRAPAAYAVLQGVVAEQAAAVGGGVGGEGASGRGCQWEVVGRIEAVAAQAAAAEAWLQQEEQQQQREAGMGSGSCSSSVKGAVHAAAGAAAAAGRTRGVFADITSGLNSHSGQDDVGLQSGTAAGLQAFRGGSHWQELWPESDVQGLGGLAGAADLIQQQQLGGTGGDDGGEEGDWRTLPLIDEEPEQQQRKQPHPQQQQQVRRAQAWACDFGHLEAVAPPPARATGARQRRASGKPHKKWSETWVGDFGHLQEFPRFCRETAFQHEGQPGNAPAEDDGVQPPAPSSKLLMSPADLQALMSAAGRLADMDHQPPPTQHDTAQRAAGAAAGGGGGDEDSTGNRAVAAGAWAGEEGEEGGAAYSAGAAAAGASMRSSLAARLAGLLSRWDAQAAEGAAELPAGVAARAGVSRTAAATLPQTAAAAAEPAASPAAAAADPGDGDGCESQGCPEAHPAQSVGAVSSDHGYGLHLESSSSQASRQQSGAVAVAATDAAGLLWDLQQTMSELSAAAGVDDDDEQEHENAQEQSTHYTLDPAAVEATSPAAAVGPAGPGSGAGSAQGEGSSVSLPAEVHLEGMQEASQVLAQALSRHDALMQLIASLGGVPGSEGGLLSSTGSGSEFTT